MNKFVNVLVRMVRVLVRPLFPVKVYGEKNIENKKSLIVGNHLSGWDPIILTMWTKNVLSFVYKAEFRKIAFLRWVFDGLDCVPVRRGDADLTATKSILHLLKNDKAVFLFPEGTRNKTDEIFLPFKSGATALAIKTKTPIIPVVQVKKIRLFKLARVYYGDPFELSEFYDKKLAQEDVERADEILLEKMKECYFTLSQIIKDKKKGK